MIIEKFNRLKAGGKAFGWLIDPDKSHASQLPALIEKANEVGPDLILVGGSLIFNHVDELVVRIKSMTEIPVILFPGSPLQLSTHVDALLFLSLISGRNPEYLIGNHVVSAPFIKESGVEVIPTGYILVEGGQSTSVSYISNTAPIPSDKSDIAMATAMAGELLGLRMIYLDAGSGARNPVPPEMIRAVSRSTGVPLMVGGGIRTSGDVREAYESGADIVIVGTALEGDGEVLDEMVAERDRFSI
jgi:phosphoglycerol geranylgeranyltransferase